MYEHAGGYHEYAVFSTSNVVKSTGIEQRFCDARRPDSFRSESPSNVDDRRKVKVAPVSRSVVDSVKRGVEARPKINDRCFGMFSDMRAILSSICFARAAYMRFPNTPSVLSSVEKS